MEKIRKEISALIDNLKEKFGIASGYEKIPQEELKNILSDVSRLYEKTVILGYLNEHGNVPPDIVNNNYDDSYQQKRQAGIIGQEQQEAKDETNALSSASINPATRKKTREPEKNIRDINSRLSEKHLPQGSLNEKIGQNKLHASISGKISENLISDLSKAIGVNERYLFTRELFNNDPREFTDAVKRLNSLQNYAEALHVLEELRVKNNWEPDSATVKSFSSLVQRRY